MKIGLICPYDISKGGGVQECVRALQYELTLLGHSALIITPLPRASGIKKSNHIIFVGVSTDVKSLFHTTGQVSVSVNTRALDDMLNQEQFDVLHFHEPWVPMISNQILSRSTAKNVATFHAKLPETIMNRTIERVITPYTKSSLKYLHKLTAVSDAAAEYVRTLTNDTVEIIPNGIDLTKYENISKNTHLTSGRTILYVGRLERRKGVKFLIKAYAELVRYNSDVNLLVAGEGPGAAKLKAMVKSLSVPNVEFLGFVDEKRKLELLRQASLFCSPALYGESFGIVLLEAMAAKLPLIAGNNPGYINLMRGSGALSIVNPKDTIEFARRLELLLYDENIRQLWREWASDYIQQFNYPKVIKQYEHLYATMVPRSPT